MHYCLTKTIMDHSCDSEKGVPEFWLTAMKTNDTLAEEVD